MTLLAGRVGDRVEGSEDLVDDTGEADDTVDAAPDSNFKAGFEAIEFKRSDGRIEPGQPGFETEFATGDLSLPDAMFDAAERSNLALLDTGSDVVLKVL